jgi:hypothetical protein
MSRTFTLFCIILIIISIALMSKICFNAGYNAGTSHEQASPEYKSDKAKWIDTITEEYQKRLREEMQRVKKGQG